MHILSQRNQEFCWDGEGTASGEKRRTCLYFRSFFLGDERISVGDFVLIRNDDSIDPEDVSNCYVGQIKDLYDNGDLYEPHQAQVQWFSRVTELPPYAHKFFDELFDLEVIAENRPNWSDTVDADTIFSKCLVHFLPVTADFSSFEKVLEEIEGPEFFCRYKYTGTKLLPKLKNELGITPLQNSPLSVKMPMSNDVTSRRKRTSTEPTSQNGNYVAVPTGTEQFPRVLIKRMDNRVLEGRNSNVRIIVAKPDAKTIDDVADSIKNSLHLSDPVEFSEKRPIIHSLNNNVEEQHPLRSSSMSRMPSIDSMLSTPVKQKRTSNLKSATEAKIRSSPRFQSCGRPKRNVELSNTPGKTKVDSSEKCNTPRASKTTKAPATDGKVSMLKKLENGERSFTPKISARTRTPARVRDVESTPSPSKRLSRADATYLVSSPSPSKKAKTARKSLTFFTDQEVAVTRSGRKVKAVNYYAQEHLEELASSLTASPLKPKKLSRFIRANYSDDSGSEFDGTDKSSSEDSDSDSKEKPVCPPTRKASTRTPRSSIKKKPFELSIPERKTPLKAAQNLLEESRLRLHVSAVPKSLPCREEEYSDIYNFVRGNLNSHTGGCMYISGVPGTGKTATVHEVIRNLEQEKEVGDVPLFTFVEVNGMWMTDPYQCYVHIFKSLTGKTIASQQAANLLEKRFTESGPKKDAVILLVDELDRLWTRKQTVMYNIFDWPSKKHSRLIVLAIANTMDLPERLMMNRISSRLGLTRKTFQPYNFRQLQEIIMSRIQELKVFDPDAVQLVARKVAAVSGDARRALDICRHATEVINRMQSSPRKKHKVLVGMDHVNDAIQEMFSSPVIAAIKSSSELAKAILQSMLSEFTRTGSEETMLIKISTRIVETCKFEGVKPPTSTEISNVCAQLAASHLILVDNFQNDIYMKLRLSVSPDDVNYALHGKGLNY